MYFAQITIPKMSDTYKIYVYTAKNAESINTIAKVKTIKPSFVIDEAVAKTYNIDGRECYVLYDRKDFKQDGVEYNGPFVNIIPTSEYATKIDMVKLNQHTYVNELTIEPLPVKYNGTMIYYSCIGVDEENSMITHLSEVKGVMVRVEYKTEGTRHLYSSEDGKKWNYVTAVKWDEDIKIGNKNSMAAMDRFGIPVVETVPIFKTEDVTVSLKPITRNFVVLEIPNPWQKNNETYNFRKLKSYKLQNVVNEQYGDFSEPTFQSLLPLSIEKMVILRRENGLGTIPLEDMSADDITKWEIIRNAGIFYNRKEHKKYGLNKFNIPLGENIAIFSEGSTQDKIKIQAESLPVKNYMYTVYLIDVYGQVSEPCDFVVHT